MIKTLDRYIFTQLLDYFMLGMVIFTLIGFFSDSFLDFIQDIQKFGISFTTALTMMGLQLPKIVALVMPASSFLAVLMVYSGLNAAFEITAIRMNGISLGRLVLPALTLGLMASVFAYLLGDYAVPYCNQQTEALKNQAIEKGTLPVGRESFTFKDYDDTHQLRKMIYIGKYSGRKLQDTTIIDLSKPSMMQVIQSKSGEWYPDHWVFENANAYTVSKTSETLFFNHLGEFSIKNLIDHNKDKEKLKEEKDQEAKGLSAKSKTQPFAALLRSIQKRELVGESVNPKTYIRLWEKLTMPLSCMVIILTAVPLALTPPRSGANRGFIFALGALFFFYVIRSVFVNIGLSGQFTLGGLLSIPDSLILASWFPLVLMVILGLTLLARKSKVL